MSGYRKGTRKPKSVSLPEFSVGGYKVPPALLISSLLVTLYALFLFGSRIEKGIDALVLAVFSLVSFATLSYLSRAGSIAGLRPFTGLIDAFLALSALTFAWDLIIFFNVLAGLSGILMAVAMSIAFTGLSILLLGSLISYEKYKPKDIFLRAGTSMSLISGVVGFVLCFIFSLVVLYFLFGGSAMGIDKLAYLCGMLLLFSLLSAAYEEAWFRGLLLSRLGPLVGEKGAGVLQALAFGVFEAFAVYSISPQLIYLPAVFIISSILGYYWGRMTLKEESIVSATLYHAGFYVLIGVPLFAGML
jgi:CAAX protease family protein